MNDTNPFMLADSYKYSHFSQYPENTQNLQAYFESRGGEYDEIVFFGLRYVLSHLAQPRLPHYRYAKERAAAHGIPFNSDFLDLAMQSSLPLNIWALPEGSVTKPGKPLFIVEASDPRFAWVVGFAETLLSKVWYPCTVATRARSVRQVISKYWHLSVDIENIPGGLDFAYHNFGDRGASSVESAYIGGLAHLTMFKGTDNFSSIDGRTHYSHAAAVLGYSIPASEHSTVTSWGKNGEANMIRHYLADAVINSWPMIACVLDSYDIYNAVDMVTFGEFRDCIESDKGPIFVIRPDSGDPIKVMAYIWDRLKGTARYTVNSKGFKVFDKYRVIWGDGIDQGTIEALLQQALHAGVAASNLAFGSGGNLMQQLDRDTCRFAYKVCAIQRNDTWFPVFKQPVTDPGKKSKAGPLSKEGMEQVMCRGALTTMPDFDDIRSRCYVG